MNQTLIVTDNKDIVADFFGCDKLQSLANGGLYQTMLPEIDHHSLPIDFWQELFTRKITFGIRKASQRIRAVFFDMDGTVVCQESIDLLGELAGKKEEISNLTELAMSGALSFSEVYHRRLQILADKVKPKDLNIVASQLKFATGIEKTIAEFKKEKIKVFLLSSGFYQIVKKISDRLQFDDCMGNSIKFVDGVITADQKHGIIDGGGKRNWLMMKCQNLGIDRHQVAVVGDGANDVAMMQQAGVAVGFLPHRLLVEYVSAVNFSGDHRFLIPLITS